MGRENSFLIIPGVWPLYSLFLYFHVFWNAIGRIVRSWIFFLKVSSCCSTLLLKLTEICRPWDTMRVPASPEGCRLPTHGEPTWGWTPGLHAPNRLIPIGGWFPPHALQISVDSRLAYITFYALIHNCIGCETSSNCVVIVFYITFYIAVVADLFFLLLWLKSKKTKKKGMVLRKYQTFLSLKNKLLITEYNKQ